MMRQEESIWAEISQCNMNLYEILEVPFNAPKEEILNSFRKLSKKYHPDINKNSPIDYTGIIEAYKILIDDKKKSDYNRKYLEEINKKSIVEENRNSRIAALPFERIEYCHSLMNMLINNKEENTADQDIILTIKPLELKIGITAIIELPARTKCNVCYGNNINCYRCNGAGWIKTTFKILFKVPSTVIDTEIIEYPINTTEIMNKNLILKIKSLRIRIRMVKT